jgi:hypothetical protein
MKTSILFTLFIFLSIEAYSQSPKIKVDGKFVNLKSYLNLLSEPSVKWENNSKKGNHWGLRGPVKSMKMFAEVSPNIHRATLSETGYIRSNGKVFKVDIALEFDESGKIIERKSIIKEGQNSYRYVYEYNDAGFKTNEKTYRPYNKLVSEKRIEYNDFNQKTSEKKYENDTLVSQFKIKYDQKNKIAISYYTEVKYDKTRKSIYEFTEDNQRKKLIFYDFEGNKLRFLEYSYNKKSLLIKKHYQHFVENEEITTLYKYNNKDKLISEIQKNKNGKVVFEKHLTYDKQGKLIDKNSSGDSSNNPALNTKIKSSHENIETISTDEYGNWIIQSISTVNGVEYIKHREIVYF